MPQPPPAAPQAAGTPHGAESDADEPAAKVDRRRLVSSLSHSGQFMGFCGVEMA